jgi:hypothetical protein
LEKLRLKEKAEGKRVRSRVLIFCNRVKKVKDVTAILKKHGEKCAALYGEMKQEQREKVLNEFKNGKIPLLVSTDVAARGIHVTRLPVVVSPRIDRFNYLMFSIWCFVVLECSFKFALSFSLRSTTISRPVLCNTCTVLDALVARVKADTRILFSLEIWVQCPKDL